MPYGLIYSACTVCTEHCLDVNHVCITVCEELHDDDDDDDESSYALLYNSVFSLRLNVAGVSDEFQSAGLEMTKLGGL